MAAKQAFLRESPWRDVLRLCGEFERQQYLGFFFFGLAEGGLPARHAAADVCQTDRSQPGLERFAAHAEPQPRQPFRRLEAFLSRTGKLAPVAAEPGPNEPDQANDRQHDQKRCPSENPVRRTLCWLAARGRWSMGDIEHREAGVRPRQVFSARRELGKDLLPIVALPQRSVQGRTPLYPDGERA